MSETTFAPIITRNVSYSGTAGTVSASSADCSKIRVYCTTDAFVKVGNGTATSADMPVTAKVPEYFDMLPGQTVSAIQQSTTGSLYVTEMAKLKVT